MGIVTGNRCVSNRQCDAMLPRRLHRCRRKWEKEWQLLSLTAPVPGQHQYQFRGRNTIMFGMVMLRLLWCRAHRLGQRQRRNERQRKGPSDMIQRQATRTVRLTVLATGTRGRGRPGQRQRQAMIMNSTSHRLAEWTDRGMMQRQARIMDRSGHDAEAGQANEQHQQQGQKQRC